MFRTVVITSVVVLSFLIEIDGIRMIMSSCPQIRLERGRVRYRQKGRFVKFQCNTGYVVAGDRYSTCIRGSWDSPVPKCVRASCPKVKPPLNGEIYESYKGAVLNFFCKAGYDLKGYNISYCDGRRWDNNLPSCVKSNSKPPLSCDFESEDLCGWTQDLRHDFDWIRLNTKTPSGYLGTGPSYDHTKGEDGKGYYMYIESSTKKENETARLISPMYDKTDTSSCFKFYYHMYGAMMGGLRVYVKKFSDSWSLDPNKAIFSVWGNHDDKWLEGFVKFDPVDDDFQIIIEGVNGPSYTSDLAIDDVQLTENCTVEEVLTTELPGTAALISTESCFNRCGGSDSVTVTESSRFQIACDCDDSCLDRKTCCPDYFGICVAGVTDDLTTTYQTTRLMEVTTRNPDVMIQTQAKLINKTKKIENPDINTNSVLPKDEINQTQSNKKTYIDFKNDSLLPSKTNMNNIIPSTNTPKSTLSKQVTDTNSQQTKNIQQAKLTLVFLTPPITKPIIRIFPTSMPKVISTSKEASTPKMTSTPKLTTPKVTLLPTQSTIKLFTTAKPFKPQLTPVRKYNPLVMKKSTILIDEIATVPSKAPDIAETLSVTNEEDEDIVLDEDKPVEVLHASSGAKNAKIVIQNSEKSPKFMIVLISSICLVLAGIVCTVILVRKYSMMGCRRINRFKSGGDSQSDVRFLTSDEQLDFTLARPDDFSRF